MVQLALRLYPFEWAPFCYEVKTRLMLFSDYAKSFTVPFCGRKICSLSGDWHIAWEIPATANLMLFNMYIVAAFVMPVLYGSWRMTIYHILTGPLLAWLTTSNPNEWAAVWCLYSIGLLLILVKTPIRRYLHVQHWFWWRFVVKLDDKV